MMVLSSQFRKKAVRALFLLGLAVPMAGCLFRTRPVEQQYSKAPLQAAAQQELIDRVARQAAQIQALQATVDIDSSSGGVKKGHITDYKEIRGYVLLRKPGMLRMIGLLPVVRTTGFDMTSDGQQFKLWIPPRNRFVIGRNEMQALNPAQPLENLRPQNIFEALLIQPVDPSNEIAVLENGQELLHDSKGRAVVQDDYELVVIHKTGERWALSRKIIFSRVDLQPDRQLIYDDHGNLASEARYADYKDYDGISFPSRIEIRRPQEEYDIVLNLRKVDMNKKLTDEQFVLEQPAGADVVNLDHPQPSTAIAK
jgi:outer membrane lipoprotein-sorting protein